MRDESDPLAAPPFPVLIVEDDPVQSALLRSTIEKAGGRSVSVPSVAAARAALDAPTGRDFRVLLLDLMLPDGNGLEILAHLRDVGIEIPAIVQTSKAGLDVVVGAMRAGAFDFLVKPASPQRIQSAIAAALHAGASMPARAPQGAAPLPGPRTPMETALHLADKAARSAIPVLLTGETGVGKEWMARRIVAGGARAGRPFVAVNCGALPAELAESLLFGHEPGAFTGATRRFPGKFVEADGGTLFLDEVGELAPATQVALLRALQEGEVDPLGASAPVRTDVRIVAATHRDLEADVASGRFRADLFYRLHVFPIPMPPLRERRGEIGALAQAFARRFGGVGSFALSKGALEFVAGRDWPGNIRELENAVHRAVVLSEGPTLSRAAFGGEPEPGVEDAPQEIAQARPDPAQLEDVSGAPVRGAPSMADGAGRARPLDAVERDLISYALETEPDGLAAVARRLGIGRSTLYRKLRSHRISR